MLLVGLVPGWLLNKELGNTDQLYYLQVSDLKGLAWVPEFYILNTCPWLFCCPAMWGWGGTIEKTLPGTARPALGPFTAKRISWIGGWWRLPQTRGIQEHFNLPTHFTRSALSSLRRREVLGKPFLVLQIELDHLGILLLGATQNPVFSEILSVFADCPPDLLFSFCWLLCSQIYTLISQDYLIIFFFWVTLFSGLLTF